MTDQRTVDAFLAGDRPDDVALFLAESYVSDARLAEFGMTVDDGTLIVVDGERGRGAFQAATGTGAMEFAGGAMKREGEIDRTLTGGVCPDEGEDEDGNGDGDHTIQFLFAFAEAQNEEVGGLYADGPVIHAYAQCACGTAYSDRWLAEEA